MCFNTDCSWTADIIEKSTFTTVEPTECQECQRTLSGVLMHTTYFQEHELCQACDGGECNCVDCDAGERCECMEPAFGETDTVIICDDCNRFREAVSAAEMKEGCKRDESEPLLTELLENLQGIGLEDSERYFAEAVAMHPELHTNGYLDYLRQRLTQ